MNSVSEWGNTFLFILLVGLLAFPMTAQAEDGDPDGTRLKALLEQPDVPKEVKESLRSNNVNYDLLCSFEDLTIPGHMIWYYRLGQDHCENKEEWKDDGVNYCTDYSNHCNHLKWDPECLSKKKACP